MRATPGGKKDMWAEMITCKDEMLPTELQDQLNEHMKTAKELKVVGLLNTFPRAHLELGGLTEVKMHQEKVANTRETRATSSVTSVTNMDTTKVSAGAQVKEKGPGEEKVGAREMGKVVEKDMEMEKEKEKNGKGGRGW